MKIIYIIIGILIVGFFTYSSYFGVTFWEGSVLHNTEYAGKKVYTGYGNRLNHK